MNIYGVTYRQLEQYLLDSGEKTTKAPFIYRSIYQKQIDSFLDVEAIRHPLKEQLANDFSITLPRLVDKTEGRNTVKFLFALPGNPNSATKNYLTKDSLTENRLPDDCSTKNHLAEDCPTENCITENRLTKNCFAEDSSTEDRFADDCLIEAVLMRQKYGNSLCISSQVGCNMACAFCQSGRFKKVRNLTAAELVSQLMAVQQLMQCTISNVVLMGIGEPFDNFDNVMQFLEIIMHPHGLAIGKNHITVSTCGIVPKINDYTAHPSHGLLAISLHAPDNQTRSKLMPINRRYPVEEVMEAARNYIGATGKKVMLEYVMLQNINDTPEQAQLLADLIGSDAFHVNLIPYNETQNFDFAQSSRERILAFYDVLKKNNITVTMRREFGASVNAACGQLRADYESRQ